MAVFEEKVGHLLRYQVSVEALDGDCDVLKLLFGEEREISFSLG